jgi:hypothetical protein
MVGNALAGSDDAGSDEDELDAVADGGAACCAGASEMSANGASKKKPKREMERVVEFIFIMSLSIDDLN